MSDQNTKSLCQFVHLCMYIYIHIFVYINILDLGVFLLFSCPGQCQVVATKRDSCKMVASHTIYDHKRLIHLLQLELSHPSL